MSTPVPGPAGRWAIAHDGTRIGFDVVGDGEPLLLLAGQANSRSWWGPVRPDLAGFRTIAVDHAGTGAGDDVVDGEWSTRRFARDAVAVLDALGVGRAHLYGTSMGGRVAQWIAADHPGRVGALVLGCTSAGGAGTVPADRGVLRTLAGPPGPARCELVRLMVGPGWEGPLPVLGDDTMSTRARAGHRRASARHDAWDALPGVTAPVLVLHGDADEYTPVANGRLLAARIPAAQLVVLPGARHAYFLEQRERASAEVHRFLTEHPLAVC
ncbi:alpha/beta fold hydrolase [Pseudonocardia sp. NPDC049635]|uniref:alpha/beta fold hydrolase n=1 Tax=Pseudonocardia sp. NPDC049635 TaxID=3155506 RepID=UPI0033DEE16A